MSTKRPHTQTELGENVERWRSRRRSHEKLRGAGELAEWERDEIFIALALQLWPVDMDLAADPHYKQTQRIRMRLRWEGFRAATDAKQRLMALLQTADFVRAKLEDDS